MRKNLTISLTGEDWKVVQSLARPGAETYSAIFHKLIQSAVGRVSDAGKVRRYKALLAPHADFLSRRANAFAKAKGRK